METSTVPSGGATQDNAVEIPKLPPSCLPRMSQSAHFIEVKESGHTIPGRVGPHIKEFLGSYVLIENFRPELFLRRDFIKKFVKTGKILVSHVPGDTNNLDYRLSISKDNVMMLYMNSWQYRRFGLVAKKVIQLAAELHGTNEKCYLIEIDLNDDRLLKNNKYQDKMMNLLRRLSCINKIYFRFVPDEKSANGGLSISAANELSVEFFEYVIEEYALDGCEPVPLTKCSAVCQRIERHWFNGAQLHPNLDIAKLVHYNSCNDDSNNDNGHKHDNDIEDKSLSCRRDSALDKLMGENLGDILGIVDWLGYQLLSIDCDSNEIKSSYPNNGNPRYDVSCTQINGLIDHQHVECKLENLFGRKRPVDSGVVIRALFLYNLDPHNQEVSSSNNMEGWENISPYSNVDNNSGVVYIQDCNHGSRAADEITVIGMSALAG